MLQCALPGDHRADARVLAKRAAKAAAAGGGAARDELPQRTDVLAVFDLEGTVVDSNIVQQYLWVRSAGVRKAAWPGEVAVDPRSLPRLPARRDAATAASSSAPSCAATRACRSPASRRSCTAASPTPCYRHTSPAAIERDQGAPRRRPPHGAGHRIDRDARRAARRPVRRGRRRPHAREGRRAHRLPRQAAARRRGARRLGAPLRRGARARPGRLVRLRRQPRRPGVARAAGKSPCGEPRHPTRTGSATKKLEDRQLETRQSFTEA